MAFIDELRRQREAFLLQLESHERDALLRMADSYRVITNRLKAQISIQAARIEALRAAGEEVSAARLFQDSRLRALLAEAEREYRAWGVKAYGETLAMKEQAVSVAAQAAREDLRLMTQGRLVASASIKTLPKKAITQIVAQTVERGRLADLFEAIGPLAKQKITKALITGLATGENPNAVGARMAKDAAFGLSRGIRIARTEMMGAYRRAHTATYRANDDLVKGWRWVASEDERTCDFCDAMDGSEHDLGEEMDSHPNCRCTMAPILKSDAEIRADQEEAQAEAEGDE